MGLEKTIKTDVVVVGGGGAGCRAAVAAHDAGARTILVLKGTMGSSGATVAPGRGVAWQAADGCSAPEDSPAVFLDNILDAAAGMAAPRLSRILVYEIIDRMAEMECWGLQFVPSAEGERKRHYTAYSCFGNRPRAHCILNSGHGHAGEILMVLKRQMEMRDIEIHEHVFITDLVVDNGLCRGALALGPDGQVILYQAGAVVLSAGGARQIFPGAGRHTIDTTGDGYAAALRAGADLTNMEYCQYMLTPVEAVPMQVPGDPWALFPQVRNRLGQDILAAYLPSEVAREQVFWDRTLHNPFSTRDNSRWLDIAISTEINEGRGTPQGAILVDFSKADLANFKPSRRFHLPQDYTAPVILPEKPLLIRNTAHAVNGGVRIDENAQSTLPGLFAAGEVAAGAHGADRLGGGMVTNCQVFGCRAGKYAAEFARAAGNDDLPNSSLEGPLARLRAYGLGDRSADEVFATLQKMTGRHLMVLRSENGLKSLLGKIEELRADWLPELASGGFLQLRRAFEASNSLQVAELMARAALARQESRGNHYRVDFPDRDDEHWQINIIFRQAGGVLHSETGLLEI